jgi:hypothetical protein
MPSCELTTAFEHAQTAHAQAARELAPLLAAMAVETIREILPSATRLDVRRGVNEDGGQTLRVKRVLGTGGDILFDAAAGHPDHAVEETIDEINIEFFDPPVVRTGDTFMGERKIDADTLSGRS